ncbi:hypothetical protein PAA8504_03373 [Palleronia abyssalis]|uniref:Uncharacterized protein n=1 Tax=Palleronia abyssalis TaxID=1501240 RepID=A0A2R8BZE6_9RHOB|nr:hypothetical protein PAA8504_03373 [Palleronia abyssalis]
MPIPGNAAARPARRTDRQSIQGPITHRTRAPRPTRPRRRRLRPRAGHTCRQPHAGVRRDKACGQLPDQPGQRLRIVGSADPQPDSASARGVGGRAVSISIVHATGAGSVAVPLSSCTGRSTISTERNRPHPALPTPSTHARAAQPLEDQVGIHRAALHHPRHRHIRCRRLQTDRPLLLIRPKTLCRTRHHVLIVAAEQRCRRPTPRLAFQIVFPSNLGR